MKLRNIVLALWDQRPLVRIIKNIRTGDIRGLFHERSHMRHDGKAKQEYPTKRQALRAAESMQKKHGGHFGVYKCIFCDGFHIGKNRSANTI